MYVYSLLKKKKHIIILAAPKYEYLGVKGTAAHGG